VAGVGVPLNPNMKKLLDIITPRPGWDFKYLGMRILVEAGDGCVRKHVSTRREPLGKDLVHYVMKDASRQGFRRDLCSRDYYVDIEG